MFKIYNILLKFENQNILEVLNLRTYYKFDIKMSYWKCNILPKWLKLMRICFLISVIIGNI